MQTNLHFPHFFIFLFDFGETKLQLLLRYALAIGKHKTTNIIKTATNAYKKNK